MTDGEAPSKVKAANEGFFKYLPRGYFPGRKYFYYAALELNSSAYKVI